MDTANSHTSPAMNDLVNDAEAFLKENAVGTQNIARNNANPNNPFYAILLKKKNNVYEVRSAQNPSQYSQQAYFLQYKQLSEQGNTAAFVDIPKNPGNVQFLFTGELTGCALIVTEGDNNTYRVYHDSRPLSSTFYTNVVMAADMTDYLGFIETNPDQVPATVFLQYKGGTWTLYCQFLREDGKGGRIIRKRMSDILPAVFARVPGSYRRPPIEHLKQSVEASMSQFLQTLNDDITKFPLVFQNLHFPIPDTEDGDFVPWPLIDPATNLPNQATLSTNPAAARLRDLREALLQAKIKLRNKSPGKICESCF
jgi:hypothetical protein